MKKKKHLFSMKGALATSSLESPSFARHKPEVKVIFALYPSNQEREETCTHSECILDIVLV
jgi:hypothetical protein